MDLAGLDGLGYVGIYRGRPIFVRLREDITTAEVKRRIQLMIENTQLPPEKIRLFNEARELLDDYEGLSEYSIIDVVYGDEQAVHIRNYWEIYQTVGVHSSDQVQTLIAKYRYWTCWINDYQLNGEELDPHRSISSYNITEGTVLACFWYAMFIRPAAVSIYRGRKCIASSYDCITTGEIKRVLQGINENSQLPPQKIRLFRGGKELLDDDDKLAEGSDIDIVYGDEQAVHIRTRGWRTYQTVIQTVGVHSSDQVQTLEAKCRYLIDGLELNGEKLDPHRRISSYNITEGTVLEERYWLYEHRSSAVWSHLDYEEPVDETTEEVPPDFMNKLKDAVGRFGDVCGSLKSVISKGTCRTLAHILGTAKLDDILTFVTRLVKEVKFELPEVLQRARNKVLSDQDFIGIASSVGESWQSLGYSLGLNQVQIEHIILDNPTTRMRIFNMLKLWAKSNTGDPKAGTLLQTMWSCAGLNVHWGTIFKMFA